MTVQIDLAIGFVGIIFFFFTIAKHFGDTDRLRNEEKKEFFKIISVLFYFLSFLTVTILSFVMMEASSLEAYFPIMRALFITLFILLGLISTVGVLVVALIALFIGFMSFFQKKKQS